MRFQAYAKVKTFAVGLETQMNMPMLDARYQYLLSAGDQEEAQKNRIKAGIANEV